ncbi:hypothetical protein FDUTEX481_02854 [Tolypothrix sp. PCC 7601]|nr:hypothetical protein FDUTEX481_02854 [Tolypothrix sp. PCC 7601]
MEAILTQEIFINLLTIILNHSNIPRVIANLLQHSILALTVI